MALTPNNGWDLPDDSDPFKDGALAIRTLGNAIDASVGDGLLAWTSYTPTFNNFTVGAATIEVAKFCQIGKTVHVKVLVTLGAGSAVTGRIGVSLPVSATTDFNQATNVSVLQATGASATGMVAIATSTRAELYAWVASGTYVTNTSTSSTIPGTWTTGNRIGFTLTYEAA
jgi:hypothetical protein